MGGERLPCVVRGAGAPTRLFLLPPLFEEMNRSRRLLALVCARLAVAGIESWLPDLPATGDHEAPCAEASWSRWWSAVAALGEHLAPLHLLAVRGGALFADAVPQARSLYRFAPPQSGAKQVRDLLRTAAASEDGTPVTALEAASARGETIEAAGYSLPPALVAALMVATLPAHAAPTRTTALTPGAGLDALFHGPLVWRQAEPLDAAPLATALSDDIATWLASHS